MNLLLLDDCGRFADEWHMVGFDELRVIRLPAPDEIITPVLNDTIREQLAEMSEGVTVIAFTHTWIHPQEMQQILGQAVGCTILCRGDDFVDIVILPEKPHIPGGSDADFYDLLADQFDLDYAETTTATRAVVDEPEEVDTVEVMTASRIEGHEDSEEAPG
jgi:hypothetical protein